jgi:hypothetical protein
MWLINIGSSIYIAAHLHIRYTKPVSWNSVYTYGMLRTWHIVPSLTLHVLTVPNFLHQTTFKVTVLPKNIGDANNNFQPFFYTIACLNCTEALGYVPLQQASDSVQQSTETTYNKPVPDASLFAAVPLTSLLKELFKDEYKASYMHHNQGLPNSNKCVTSGAKHPRVAHKPADTSSGSHPLSTPLHTFGRSFCIPEKAFKQASHTRRHASNLTTTERSLLLQFVMVGDKPHRAHH